MQIVNAAFIVQLFWVQLNVHESVNIWKLNYGQNTQCDFFLKWNITVSSLFSLEYLKFIREIVYWIRALICYWIYKVFLYLFWFLKNCTIVIYQFRWVIYSINIIFIKKIEVFKFNENVSIISSGHIPCYLIKNGSIESMFVTNATATKHF